MQATPAVSRLGYRITIGFSAVALLLIAIVYRLAGRFLDGFNKRRSRVETKHSGKNRLSNSLRNSATNVMATAGVKKPKKKKKEETFSQKLEMIVVTCRTASTGNFVAVLGAVRGRRGHVPRARSAHATARSPE